MKQFFNIYGETDRRTQYISIALWFVILGVIWVFNPITQLPTPLEVYRSFISLASTQGSSNLFYNVWVTLQLQVTGIFYATVISMLFAYVGKLVIFNPLNRFVQLLRYIPVVGFTLVFYSFFSIGFGMKVAMLTAGLTFFMTTSMSAVLDSIPQMRYELAKSLGYSNWQIFTSVVFVPSLPNILEVVMQNAAMGWLMIVAVETFNRTEGGMGAMLQIYSASNQSANVYCYLTIIGAIALIEDALFRLSKRLLFPYTTIAERA
jgi:ABC-type nitrate/sulfonate/bicarbonate transport system permease component